MEVLPVLLDISDKEFRKISELVYANFGINLTDKKKALVKGRLNKVVRNRGCKSFDEYYQAILGDTKGEILIELINQISTNHTFFFREKAHFDYLADDVLPRLLTEIEPDDLRIWCAGCATGEEAYSLAITLREAVKDKRSFRGRVILATDISVKALETAQRGVYSRERAGNVSDSIRRKYFDQLPDSSFQVKQELMDIVLFRRLNFLSQTYPFKSRFHIVFCRNVMIYFDTPTKETLIHKISQVTRDNGYLFVGHSETLGREQQLYSYVQPAVYMKAVHD
ncbi:MAG: protein-glutamate O-methyltransferase CheR [Spirochaetales bacterium]|nr:protein-glutamate O-methyltransferase CheR [Spirochaetales bacterium]